MDGDFARGVSYEISYGKLRVPLYRVYASPLSGVPPIPESAFTASVGFSPTKQPRR